MSARLVCIAAVLALASLVQAGEKRQDWGGSAPKALSGDYQVYGGTLSGMLPPTSKDLKVAFMFKGPLAKDLFNQIGPDAKDSCSGAAGYRERRRDHLDCTHDQNGYLCYFGLVNDARSGDIGNGPEQRGHEAQKRQRSPAWVSVS